jgi:tetratricopeptide (TPR) repeat protein
MSRQALLLAGRDEAAHAVDPPFPYPGPLRLIRSMSVLKRYVTTPPTSQEGALEMGMVMLDCMRAIPDVGSELRHQIGGGLLALYVHTNERAHLMKGIAVLRKAFIMTSSDESKLRPVYDGFYAALGLLYGETGDEAPLEELIDCTERMIASSTDGPDKDKLRQELYSLLTEHYSKFHHLDSLDKALPLLPDDDPKLEPILSAFCDLVYHQYKTSGDRSDLLKSFTSRKRWVAIDQGADPEKRVRNLITLVHQMRELNQDTPPPEDLRLGIQWCENAASFEDHLTLDWKAQVRSYHSAVLFDLARVDFHPDCVENAIKRLHEFLTLAPEDHRNYIIRMDNIVTLLMHQASTRSVLEGRLDIQQALVWAKKLVSTCEPDHPRYLAYLHNLGTIHHWCFLYGSDDRNSHLQKAWDILESAESSSTASEFRPMILSALATTLGSLYEADRSKNGRELQRSLDLLRDSIRINSDNPAEILISRRLLGGALRLRYDETRDIDVLDEAIKVLSEALNSNFETPTEQHLILRELCGSYHTMFGRTHNPDDIKLAIQHGRDGLQLSAGTRDKAQLLNSLSNSYYSRFEFEGESGDLDEAIRLKQQASQDRDDPLCASYLTDLADHFRLRCFLRPNQNDIDDAICVCQEALDMLTREDIKFAYALSTMGFIHQQLFIMDGKLPTIEKAIQLGTESIDLLSSDPDSKAVITDQVAHMFFSKYQKWKSEVDLSNSIRLGKDALALISKTSPRFPMVLLNLSSGMHEHVKQYNTIRYETDIRDQMSKLLSLSISRPMARVRALRLLAFVDIREQSWKSAFDHLSAAIVLYPKISPRAFSIKDQQDSVRELAGVVQICASCGLNAGCDPGQVLEVLEAGRGITAGWTISARNDISRLAAKDSVLADRYLFLRDQVSGVNEQLEVSAQTERSKASSLTKQDQWRSHLYELEDIERRVQSEYADLRSFQRPLTVEEIKSLAERIPIVEINSTVTRSDVFIITGTAVTTIQLPSETYEKMESIARTLLGAGRQLRSLPLARSKTNEILRRDLKWLYEHVVSKVLEHLKISPRPLGPTQRVIWVSNGAASFCPLHAADAFSTDKSKCTNAHVVSSYIPSLKALQFSRESLFDIDLQGHGEVLVVAMPKTKGQTKVSADEESRNIAASFSRFPKDTVQILSTPSRKTVLEQLKGCAVAHFACHGFANSRDPSRSCLMLADSMVPGKPDKLAAADLSATRHSMAKLCYLSACSTAENPAVDLTDENIHVASAFQLSGFAHVVGTLWEAGDQAAVDVAKVFYDELAMAMASKGKQVSVGNHDVVAHALHTAVEALKHSKRPGSRLDPRMDVLSWAPFIHLGP